MENDKYLLSDFVDFLHVDFENVQTLPENGRRDIFEKYKRVLLEFPGLIGYTDIFFNGDISAIVDFQRKWLECLSWIIDKLKNPEIFFQIDVTHVFCQSSDKLLFGPVGEDDNFRKIIAAWHDNDGKPTEIEEKVFPKGVFKFFSLLNGNTPQNTIRHCSLCSRIFINPTLKTKLYCSPKCQKNAGVQRVRAKQKMSKGE